MNLFKKDYEYILSGLNNLIKTANEEDYKEISKLYDALNEEYEELLEITQEETEDYDNQCQGCGEFISGGRICRECSGV